MCFQRMTFFSIRCESFATLLFAGFVGAYKFGDAWESLGERRYLIAEIDQEVNRAKEALRGQVSALVISGAEQVLEGSVDQAKHNEMLDRLAGQL